MLSSGLSLLLPTILQSGESNLTVDCVLVACLTIATRELADGITSCQSAPDTGGETVGEWTGELIFSCDTN